MAEVRKSARQAQARKRARERAAEFREKQDKLEHLAADYFVAAEEGEEIERGVEREIEAVRARAVERKEAARQKERVALAAMLDLGAPRAEVGERVGLTAREVKRLVTPDEEAAQNSVG